MSSVVLEFASASDRRRGCWLAIWLAVGCVALAPPARGERVYESRFAKGEKAADGWSIDKIGAVAGGKRACLGPFTATERTALSLNSLPAHAFVRVEVELMVLGPWRGESAIEDIELLPSTWTLQVEKGPTLFQASLDNKVLSEEEETLGLASRDASLPRYQTYPCLLAGERLPALRGSAEHGTLGAAKHGDAVYRLHFTFPHQSDALVLECSAENLLVQENPADNARWALGKVAVETLTDAEAPTLSADEWSRLWKELAARDPQTGYEAAWRAIGQGDRSVKYFAQRLADQNNSSHKALQQQVKKLLVDLDSDRYAVRQQATRQLIAIAGDVSWELRRAMQTTRSAEVRARLHDIHQQAELYDPGRLDDDSRRKLRIDRILELLHTKAADELRHTLNP